MLRGLDGLADVSLTRWIEASLASGQHQLARGYQGQTLLYQDDRHRLVIKAPSGRGLRAWVSRLMLRHEARVYGLLDGVPGVPRCHGLLAQRYLVLEYIAGQPARTAAIADREAFFAELLSTLQSLHARGVAHSDLQKKDNLLLVDGRHPCLIDFGAAVIRKAGFAPFNRFHYRLAERLDFNQWAKLKCRGRFEQLSASDRRYYRRTSIEKFARAFKPAFRLLRNLVSPAKK